MAGSVILCVIGLLAWTFGAPVPAIGAEVFCGKASYYGAESGHRTANGEHFDGTGMTAAHRTLPFGTRVLVTDQITRRSVTVRINDRGPAAWTHRIIDLSRSSAVSLGIIQRGVASVFLTILR